MTLRAEEQGGAGRGSCESPTRPSRRSETKKGATLHARGDLFRLEGGPGGGTRKGGSDRLLLIALIEGDEGAPSARAGETIPLARLSSTRLNLGSFSSLKRERTSMYRYGLYRWPYAGLMLCVLCAFVSGEVPFDVSPLPRVPLARLLAQSPLSPSSPELAHLSPPLSPSSRFSLQHRPTSHHRLN